MVNQLTWELTVRFVNIVWIVNHHCLNFLFKMFEGLLFQSTTNAINIIKSKVLVNYKAFFIIRYQHHLLFTTKNNNVSPWHWSRTNYTNFVYSKKHSYTNLINISYFLYVALVCLYVYIANSNVILNIAGAISDESDVMIYTGFYYSVAMLRKQPFRPFDLITPVETIEKTNSFQLAQASKLQRIHLFVHGCSVFIFT